MAKISFIGGCAFGKFLITAPLSVIFAENMTKMACAYLISLREKLQVLRATADCHLSPGA